MLLRNTGRWLKLERVYQKVRSSWRPVSFRARAFSCQTSVVARDQSLLLLNGCTSYSGEFKKLSQGDLLYQREQPARPVGVVLFEAFGTHFGCVLPGKGTNSPQVNAGEGLEVRGKLSLEVDVTHGKDRIDPFDLLLSTEDGGFPVFRSQPRDVERERILDCWLTEVAAVDMLVPIGRGQSMLFVEESSSCDASFLSHVVKGISKSSYNADLESIMMLSHGLDSDGGVKCTKIPRVLLDISQVDDEAQSTLAAFVGCALCEIARDRGSNSLLVLPQLAAMQVLWERARALFLQNHIELGSAANNAQVGADRADLRSFYSSLMQRAAKLNKSNGSGSLTILGAIAQAPSRRYEGLEDKPVTVEELKASGQYSTQVLSRLQLLEDKSITITDAVLEKLGIPKVEAQSSSGGPYSTAKQHTEELKSLCDGHISCLQPEHHIRIEATTDIEALISAMPFDPRDSLTRIGVGRYDMIINWDLALLSQIY